MNRILVLFPILLFLGCHPTEAGKSVAETAPTIQVKESTFQPDLLLVTLDTTRADHLQAYGYHRPTSPNLKNLVSQGIRLDRLLAPIPLTTPSHATLMTGMLPIHHGVFANYGGYDRLSEETQTLAESLLDAGYQTGASIAAFTAGKDVGLSQGFQKFYEPDYDVSPERPAKAVLQDANKILTSATAKPLFLWTHFFDAHGPYTPTKEAIQAIGPAPDGFDLDAPLQRRPPTVDTFLYDAELWDVDNALGVLIEQMRLRKRPLLIVVLGDHGETLAERPLGFQHGRYLFEEALRVPGVFVGEGIPENKTLHTLATISDVNQTIYGLLDIKSPPSDGQDLSEVWHSPTSLHAKPGALQDALVSEDKEEISFALSMPCDPSRGMKCAPKGARGRLQSMTAGRWKLILTPNHPEATIELYRLDRDPGERNNIAQHHPKVCAEMIKLMRKHFEPLLGR